MVRAALVLLLSAAQDQEAAVRETLSKIVQAEQAGDGRTYVELLHLPRMLQEMEKIGAFSMPKNKFVEVALLANLRQGLREGTVQEKDHPFRWDRIRVTRVRIDPDGRHAEAFALIRDPSRSVSRTRFRLVQEGGAWKIFDWEELDDGVRFSATVAHSIAAVQSRGIEAVGRCVESLDLAGRRMHEGDFEGALESIRASRPGAPAFLLPQIDLLEGSALRNLSRFEEAIELYDAAQARQADFPVLHYLRGEALLELGRHADAIREAQEYLDRIGEDADGYGTIGSAYEALEDFDAAEDAYRRGIAADPDEADCRYGLAALLLGHRGRPDEARELFSEACRNAADEEAYFESAAVELHGAEAWEAMRELSAEHVERRPDNPDGRYYLGSALSELGRYAEAEAALRAGMAMDSETEAPFYWRELAVAAAHQGRYGEATAMLVRLSAVDTTEAFFYLRACVHAIAGRETEAIEDLARVLELEPDYSDSLDRDRDLDRIRGSAGFAALRDRARKVSAFLERADELLEAGDHAGLAEAARAHVAEAPEDDNGHYYLGYALESLGRHAEAEAAYRAGLARVRHGPSEPYRYRLALTLARSGRFAESAEQLGMLRGADPDAEGVKFAEALLEAARGEPEAALEAAGRLLAEAPWYLEDFEDDAVFEAMRGLAGWGPLAERAKQAVNAE